MKHTLFLVVALSIPAAAQIPELQWARSPDSGWWFGFTPTTTTWHQGEALGVANGGHLATIRSAAENAWLGSVITTLGGEHSWIGLNDVAVEGQFAWTSGLPVTFTAWQSGEPGAFSPAHDAAVKSGSLWFVAPPTYGLNRPVIERDSLPPEGWRAPIFAPLPILVGRFEVGDADGDGNVDVFAVSRQNSGPTFAVLRGLGGGAWAPAQTFGTVHSGPFGAAIELADFDADGHDDVALTVYTIPNQVHVFFAGPSSDFATRWSPTPNGVVENASPPAAADFDGDGRDDLIFGRNGSAGQYRLLLYRSDPTGTFLPPIEYTLTSPLGEITAADFDADLDVDWIVGLGSTATVFLNDGTGTAPATTTIPMLGPMGEWAHADFDGDGRVDLAMRTGPSDIRILWGDGAGGFDLNGPVVLSIPQPYGICSADFDGDGRADLCASGANELRVVRGSATGAFSLATSLFGGPTPHGARAADVDGDGRPEIISVVEPDSGSTFPRVSVVRRFAVDCDADGVDDTAEIRDDPALDLDQDRALDACAVVGDNTCPGDGSAAACPCGNASAPGAGEGCAHSFGTGGRLDAHGLASLSADSVRLDGTRMPNSSALYFQGTTSLSGGLGDAFGDGLRCAGGSVVRLVTRTNRAGASGYPDVGEPSVSARGGVVVPGSRTYQVWYRNAAAFCTPSTFNLTNGVRIDWIP